MSLNPFKGADLNDLQEFFDEKYSKFKQDLITKVKADYAYLREKGRERLTVMLIPHSEKKIFKLELSLFSITFLVSILAIVVFSASITIINHSSTVKEVDILIGSEKDSKKLIAQFELETKRLGQLMTQFKPEISGLYAITSGSEKKAAEMFGGMGGPVGDVEHIAKDQIDNEEMANEIYDIESIRDDLAVASRSMDDVKSFLLSRKKIIENTPSVWPTEGYIASTFGDTINPFSGLKEYNPGIDIVAMPGAEVRATAPGKVIFAGWHDELGLLVRIRHKYGYVTSYGHNQRLIVQEEQKIAKNEIIGFVGRTGIATKNMLHYRVKIGTVNIDPVPYLNRIRIQ